jgi:hypothetical protein
VREVAEPVGAGVLGAIVSGALGGLAADLAAGDLTFGAGALIGGLLGAAGMTQLARAYNSSRGSGSTVVSWSPEFMTARVSAAVLRYLAAAHFGRGRGEYVQSEYPHHWVSLVDVTVRQEGERLTGLWAPSAEDTDPRRLASSLEPLLTECTARVLDRLYLGGHTTGVHGHKA